MKILLIVAAHHWDPLRKQDPFMPLALPILASCAPEHQYTFVNLLCQDESLIDFEADYDLVGISFRVSATTKAFELADRFRAQGKTVVMGGPQPSSIPLEAKQHADAVVIGEAEETWPVLLDDFSKGGLRDFYLSHSGFNFDLQHYSAYAAEQLPDLTRVPIPIRFPFKEDYTFRLTYAARGCPIDCHFCSVSGLFGKRMRYRNIDDVVQEIDQFGNLFYLIDDNVFGRKDSYPFYKTLYEKIAQLKKKRFWTGQANLNAAADEEGREVIRLASLAGLCYAAIGLETLDPKDMEHSGTKAKMGLSGKHDALTELGEHIRTMQEQGIAISGWFTIGLENDSIDLWHKSLQFCIKNHIFPVFSPIQALEGTRYFNEMKAQNKLLDNDKHVSNVKHANLTNQDFINILQYTIKEAYSLKILIKNTGFYLRKSIRLKRDFRSFLFRIIFVIITQLRLKKVLQQEVSRFQQRTEHAV